MSRRGIIEVEKGSRKVTRFLEKPGIDDTDSRNACPAFYVLRNSTITLLDHFLESKSKSPLIERDAPGQFIKWLISESDVRAIPIDNHFKIDSLIEYKKVLDFYTPCKEVTEYAYARAGLIGNPSDGYFGKTIALSISQYSARVTIRQGSKIVLVPHLQFDRETFESLDELTDHTDLAGYYGGLRLMRATCKRFCELCRAANIPRPPPFTITYSTNIPFACGMSGSSAIITASFKALLRYSGLKLSDLGLNRETFAGVILSVEKDELGINAGLQDRVIQVFEGVVYMDFAKELFDNQGYGNYSHITAELPPLYMAHLTKPGGDSGKAHNNVKQRWLAGDKEVHAAMIEFGSFAAEGKNAIEQHDWKKLAELMDKNFQLRRKIFGEAALGSASLQMIKLANKHNFSAKFTGSGGAIVCLYRGDGKKEVGSELTINQENEIKKAFNAEGFYFGKIKIAFPSQENDSILC
eukprot:c19456_g1_i3.p1 GENE.c19456_g1_i3~~c19456_g1_i3.p1  ORF type:complete len:467 (-),score=206.45 c19456_g1_i3:37-1437(-)